MPDLTDYEDGDGGGSSPDRNAPVVAKRGPCKARIGGESVTTVGWYGPVVTREPITRGYGTRMNNRLRARDAFAISDRVIDILRSVGIRTLLVGYTETVEVYEWDFSAWLDLAEPVPEGLLNDPNDPQQYVPRDSARDVWDNHVNRFLSDGAANDDNLPGFNAVSEMMEGNDGS